MLFAFLLADNPPPPSNEPAWGSWIFMFLPILVIFYFVMILPMRRQEKQRKALISSLKKNDKIINSGGIIGVVESVKPLEDEVVLRGNVRITLTSIVKVVPPEDAAKEQKPAGA